MTLQETIAAIRDQGGLVYVPHPFDRMHSVPDYEHLLDVVEDVDAIEVFNPRVAFSAFNEEAERFAAKYRIVAGRGVGQPRGGGAGLGEDPDARLRRARRSSWSRCATPTSCASKQSLLYVQALKFIQTKATPETGAPAHGPARRRAAAGRGGKE